MSIPFSGKAFTFTQPDGTQLQVRGWGDQYHAVFETLEGFTVVQDPVSGFYQYAQLSSDHEDLKPTGMRAGAADPTLLGLAPGARVTRAAALAKAREHSGMPPGNSRWEQRRKEAKDILRLMAQGGVLRAPPQRTTVGTYVGLCLLIQFPDMPGTISRQEVDDFCNKPGYSGFGNNGSVRDYFADNSRGKLTYTSVVAPYYTAKHPRSYYTNEQVPQPTRARQLIKEALQWFKQQGFDFSKLTVDDQQYVYAVNCFYAGSATNHWAKGLWPHSYHLQTAFQVAPGKQAYDYQITDFGNELTLGTFCHENGHMICDYPDLYDYGNQSNGVGAWCLMCSGPNVAPKNPPQIDAYLKYKSGWADEVTTISNGLNAVASATENHFFLHRKSPTEYYIIENRNKADRDAALPGTGLAIWHVDETGDQNFEQMTPVKHYELSLVQADGRTDLEAGANDGDATDLYSSPGHTVFSGATNPASKWWDGSTSNLEINTVGVPGSSMTFKAKL